MLFSLVYFLTSNTMSCHIIQFYLLIDEDQWNELFLNLYSMIWFYKIDSEIPSIQTLL